MLLRGSKDPNLDVQRRFNAEKANAEPNEFKRQTERRLESIRQKQEAEQRRIDEEKAAKTPVGSVQFMSRSLKDLKEKLRSDPLADEDASELEKALVELEKDGREARELLGRKEQNLLELLP